MGGFLKSLTNNTASNTNNATSYNDEDFTKWNTNFIGDSGITNDAIREAIEKGAAIGDKYRAYGKHGAGDRLDLAKALKGILIEGSSQNLYDYLEKMSGLTGRDFRRGISTYFDNALTNWDDTYRDSHARFSTIFGMPGTDPKQKTFAGHDPLTALNKRNEDVRQWGFRLAVNDEETKLLNNLNTQYGDLKAWQTDNKLNADGQAGVNTVEAMKKWIDDSNISPMERQARMKWFSGIMNGKKGSFYNKVDDKGNKIKNSYYTLSDVIGNGTVDKLTYRDYFNSTIADGDGKYITNGDKLYLNWGGYGDVNARYDAAMNPKKLPSNSQVTPEIPKPYDFYKSGGNIEYFKGGGKPKKSPKKSSSSKQGGIEKQIIGLVQAAMQGDQLATQAIQQVMQAAQSGDQQAVQMAQMILQTMQELQGAAMAKQGTKLGYISKLNMFKNGGHTCSKCLTEKLKCGGKKKLALNGDKLNKISKLCKGKRV